MPRRADECGRQLRRRQREETAPMYHRIDSLLLLQSRELRMDASMMTDVSVVSRIVPSVSRSQRGIVIDSGGLTLHSRRFP
jgi:hypothetical protein